MRLAAGLLIFTLACGCTASAPRNIRELERGRIHEFCEQDLGRFLTWHAQREPDSRTRVLAIARKSSGQAYRLGVLGEYPFELTDADPLYCLKASDCVTFVEQTFAMGLSRDWPTFFASLQCLRYKDGKIGILTRNHFTEADWNVNNAWVFDDVTEALGGEVRSATVRIDRNAFFSKIGIAYDGPVEEGEVRYIPKSLFKQVSGRLENADVIEFVRQWPEGVGIGHLGLIARDGLGEVTLIHSGAPCVQEVPLAEYLDARPHFVGFKVLRLKKEHWSLQP
jgi:hypothetical protein